MIQLLKDLISLVFYLFSFLGPVKNQLTLVYHSVSDIGKGLDPLKLNISQELFRKQIAYLSKLSQANGIVVTFDDGFENFFHYAYPILLRYNINSVLFITTGFIDRRISFDRLFSGVVKSGALSWEQVNEISQSGIEIGSHAVTHVNLTGISEDEAGKEIADSKSMIENVIGKSVKYFAYPYGSRAAFNERIKKIVKDRGYERAYTNIAGFNSGNTDLYELRRIRIYNTDNMFRFKMKLRGAYNWVDWLLSFKQNSL